MGRKKGTATSAPRGSAVTAIDASSHDHHPITTAGICCPRQQHYYHHHHHHPYNNYSHHHHRCTGGSGGGGGGSRKAPHRYSDIENMTTTADDNATTSTSSSSSLCHHNHQHYHHHHHHHNQHSTTTGMDALDTSPSRRCSAAHSDSTTCPAPPPPRSALATLLSSSSSPPSSPTPPPPPHHRHRRSFLPPVRLWTTFVVCALLFILTQQQQPASAQLLQAPAAAAAMFVAAADNAPATGGAQMKLNDIQSYLNSLDNNNNKNNNNINTDAITTSSSSTTTTTTATTTTSSAGSSVKGGQPEPVSLMWGIGDTMAYVGRLFTYPLPSDAFKGDIRSFKVMEAGKQDLPRWLYFNPDTRTFFGVPKTSDIAQYYIEVVAQAAAASGADEVSQFAKDVFSIHVTKESSKPAAVVAVGGASISAAPSPSFSSSSFRRKEEEGGGSSPPPVIRCMPLEPETAFTLIVDANLDQLPPHGIVGLLKRLGSSLQLVSEMFKVSPATAANRPIVHPIVVSPEGGPSAAAATTLVSGPGDTKTAKHPGVLVTWLVGCGKVEQRHMDVLQRVESISANGTLSELLGHGVVGWHVTNRQVPPPHQHEKQEKRVRRAIMATPAVTDVAPTVVATTRTRHGGGGDGMTHRVPTMESSLVQPTRTRPHHPHKTRPTDAGMTTLHPSTTGPRGGGTLRTKSLPDGMYTMTINGGSMTGGGGGATPTKPSGGAATAMPEYCAHMHNPKPRVENRMPTQEFVAGKRAEFSVPANTFVDCNDRSDQLKLQFFLENYQKIPNEFWLQMDRVHKQSMVGLPMQGDVGMHNMTMVVMNSKGTTDYLDFLVNVKADKAVDTDTVTHQIKMTFGLEYKKFMSSVRSKLDLVDKIGKLYGDGDASKVTVLSMEEGSVVVAWTNNTLAGTTCPDDAKTRALFDRLVDDKKQVRRAARRAMKPFKLQSAQIFPMGPCAEGYGLKTSRPIGGGGAKTTPDPALTKKQTDDDNDILISTVVPAVIIVSILLLALLVACILYRKKRKGKMSLSGGGGGGGEHDAYSGKGAPVIFAEELEDKPTDCQRPLILDDEKPPHPPPEYQHSSSSDSAQSTPNQDRRRPGSGGGGGHHRGDGGVNEPILGSQQPYEPPPPVTASQGKKQPRPHVQPPYRSPPPYVPP